MVYSAITRPRMTGIESQLQGRHGRREERDARLLPPARPASAAVSTLGESATSKLARPRPTLARARRRLSIVVRRAMSSEPVSDPTLNTVVMNAYVFSLAVEVVLGQAAAAAPAS